MMSPGISSKACESFEICSATLQIIWFRSAFCLTTPLTLSGIAPLVKWPIWATRWIGPIGADRADPPRGPDRPFHQGRDPAQGQWRGQAERRPEPDDLE